MNNKTLIYIDPGYLDNIGHFTRMAEIIRKEATASSIELHHHVGPGVSVESATSLGLNRDFNHRAGLQWIEKPVEALHDFYVKLDKILHDLRENDPAGQYELFMYTAHPLHLPCVAFLLNKYHAEIPDLSAHICLFYIEPELLINGGNGAEEYESMLKRVSRLIDQFDAANMITVCTDSARTAQLYGPYFKKELKTLPLPVEKTSDASVPPKSRTDGTVTIGYIGQTTQRAGYDLVYHAYKRFSTMESFNKVKFKIKHTRRASLAELHNSFLSESQNISHVDDFLTNEAYEDFLADCDILLVPYSKKHYPCQTSGIVVEALFRNKVLVVPQDTWMSDQLRDWGAGETFLSDDLEGFVQAIVKVISNFEYYKERTNRNINEFRKLHSCSNLFLELGLNESAIEKQNQRTHKMNSSTPLIEDLLIENVLLMCEKDELIRQKLHTLSNELMKRDKEIKKKEERIRDMEESYSWKITAPLRWTSNVKTRK